MERDLYEDLDDIPLAQRSEFLDFERPVINLQVFIVCKPRDGRWKRGSRGWHLKEQYLEWKAACRAKARSQWGRDPLKEKVGLSIILGSGSDSPPRYDVDNAGGAVMDALSTVCYEDDCRVDQLIVRRVWLPKDRLSYILASITPF